MGGQGVAAWTMQARHFLQLELREYRSRFRVCASTSTCEIASGVLDTGERGVVGFAVVSVSMTSETAAQRSCLSLMDKERQRNHSRLIELRVSDWFLGFDHRIANWQSVCFLFQWELTSCPHMAACVGSESTRRYPSHGDVCGLRLPTDSRMVTCVLGWQPPRVSADKAFVPSML